MWASAWAGSWPRWPPNPTAGFTGAALLLAGGDLDRVVEHAREMRELQQFLERLSPEERARAGALLRAYDPLEKAGLLRERAVQGRVLMINAAEDEVIPRACTERLAAALGISDRVIWLEGLGHYTALAALPRALATTADFFARDLPPGVQVAPPLPAAGTVQTVARLAQQLAALAGSDPAEGRGHLVDLAIQVTLRPGTIRR